MWYRRGDRPPVAPTKGGVMRWLDGLKWLLESGGYSVVLKNDYETRLDRDFRVAVDRLIAIARDLL